MTQKPAFSPLARLSVFGRPSVGGNDIWMVSFAVQAQYAADVP